MMERVAHHLQLHAWQLDSEDERDVFGRSAYNRYYYAAFLRAREMIERLNLTKSEELRHASYPQFLETRICKELKRGKEQSGKVHDQEAIRAFSTALTAAKSIAVLMRDASNVREVADYEPKITIAIMPGGRFSLNNVEITTAHQWVEKVDTWAKAVEAAWRYLDA